MIIGVPKEIKSNENRVATTPAGVEAFKKNGHSVLIEKNAGIDSGFMDEDYIYSGAQIIDTPQEIFEKAEMIIKVKEPLAAEYDLFKEGQILFTYLHLAAEPALTNALLSKKVIGIAYETIQLADCSLPLLTPMSEVAGRMAVQVGANFLEKPYGGRGVLLGGVPGTKPGKVVIIGAGIVGTNAARIAVAYGADVTILDINLDKLRYLDDLYQGRIKTLMSNGYNIREEIKDADLLIGAVLIPGARAPRLVTEDMVKSMKSGAVIVDVAIDQGGSIETIDRVTTHDNPVYEKYGVIHYSVANMPGAVARTSTFALTNATLPYALALANKGYLNAIKENTALAKGVNIINGNVVYKSVADALNHQYVPLSEVIEFLNSTC
ncbi:MAG: alanine dehydrogenase [Candidatus Melainabacteria bacterium RIFOXYA12_FULL_32_12]|nr:MAG: alanine dehydrogenase [Candidatus Melainabacteria bacterium RIFOXYA2_FULL_32_9]OGI27425.1 MAG: alanine dehydrogenase [Candidatus Melainabacteria bacterium RIFOXYA12_FULL_32_12]